jgi:hypothetical protein
MNFKVGDRVMVEGKVLRTDRTFPHHSYVSFDNADNGWILNDQLKPAPQPDLMEFVRRAAVSPSCHCFKFQTNPAEAALRLVKRMAQRENLTEWFPEANEVCLAVMSDYEEARTIAGEERTEV